MHGRATAGTLMTSRFTEIQGLSSLIDLQT
jgi:hypothetical protein